MKRKRRGPGMGFAFPFHTFTWKRMAGDVFRIFAFQIFGVVFTCFTFAMNAGRGLVTGFASGIFTF